MSDSKVLADVIGKSDDTKLMNIADIHAWMNSTWHDVAGSRSLGSANVYTNTHNYPMTVAVRLTNTVASSSFNSSLFIDGVVISAFNDISPSSIGFGVITHIVEIPIGRTYNMTASQASVVSWREKY
jgi:hypothetical protein